MDQIRAFVGHSFSPQDEPVVQSFLRFFDSWAKNQPNFSWVHAEDAQPVDLRAKVLELIKTTNTFIGICTKKERVADPSKFKLRRLWPDTAIVKDVNLQWKTTDWIIQEIGLAIGLGLELILLVEEGVRPPGGMQGNLEYIEFSRSTPEKCHRKVIEMIGALSPKQTQAAATMVGPDAQEEKIAAPETSASSSLNDEWRTPLPGWQQNDYEHAFFIAIVVEDDEELGRSIEQKYLETDEGSKKENSDIWAATTHSIRIRFGKGGEISRLKKLAEEYPADSRFITHWADALSHYKYHSAAAEKYQAAFNVEPSIKRKLALLRMTAVEYQAAGERDLAESILTEMRNLAAQEKEDVGEILYAQRELADSTGKSELFIGSMEQLTERNPSDKEQRFNLAYKYSKLGNEALSLFHYKQIGFSDRSNMVWNNLGVAYSNLVLPAKAIAAYRQAEAMGNTLAMSNIAHQLSRAGFLPEARAICDAAIKVPDHDARVEKAIGIISDIEPKEDEREKEALKEARLVSEFYSAFGKASTRPLPTKLPDIWSGPDSDLQVSTLGGKFTLHGIYEKRLNGLALIIAQLPSTATVETYLTEFSLEAAGQAFWGYVSRRKKDTPRPVRSLLGGNDDEWQVLLYLTTDGRELRVLEKTNDNKQKFYSIFAKPTALLQDSS